MKIFSGDENALVTSSIKKPTKKRGGTCLENGW